eukprot:gene9011-1617_t
MAASGHIRIDPNAQSRHLPRLLLPVRTRPATLAVAPSAPSPATLGSACPPRRAGPQPANCAACVASPCVHGADCATVIELEHALPHPPTDWTLPLQTFSDFCVKNRVARQLTPASIRPIQHTGLAVHLISVQSAVTLLVHQSTVVSQAEAQLFGATQAYGGHGTPIPLHSRAAAPHLLQIYWNGRPLQAVGQHQRKKDSEK